MNTLVGKIPAAVVGNDLQFVSVISCLRTVNVNDCIIYTCINTYIIKSEFYDLNLSWSGDKILSALILWLFPSRCLGSCYQCRFYHYQIRNIEDVFLIKLLLWSVLLTYFTHDVQLICLVWSYYITLMSWILTTLRVLLESVSKFMAQSYLCRISVNHTVWLYTMRLAGMVASLLVLLA